MTCEDGHPCVFDGGRCPRVLGLCLKLRQGDPAYIALARTLMANGLPPQPAARPIPPPASLPACSHRGPVVCGCGPKWHCMTRSTAVTREVCDLCELA